MQRHFWQRPQNKISRVFSLKRGTIGAVLLFFMLSVLIVACGSSGRPIATTGSSNPNEPVVTVTINLGSTSISPTPALPQYWCGAWATQSSPPYGTASVAVYAKFTQNTNDNPVGIAGATGTATVMWPDNTTSTLTATTGSDGLATFFVPTAGRFAALNKITLVTVSFTQGGGASCTVPTDKAAFFTLISGAGPAVGTPGN